MNPRCQKKVIRKGLRLVITEKTPMVSMVSMKQKTTPNKTNV